MNVEIDIEKKTLNVYQELTFSNESNDSLSTIVLNDWNNSYSDKNTPLAKRFSDEFVRNFHLASDKERGSTNNITFIDENKSILSWIRSSKHPDLIEIQLKNKLLPYQKIKLFISYILKIPSDKYTKYGYAENGNFNLKNWFLTPSRYENNDFIRNSNANLDDITNSSSNFEIEFKVPDGYTIITELNTLKVENNTHYLIGKNRIDFSLFLEKNITFSSYKNKNINVFCNLKEGRLDNIQKAMAIDKVVNYVTQNIGTYPNENITVSQADYERNPFYGLNQLPTFISPFEDSFIFELKFLKTYLNNYLRNTLQIDSRKDNWIIDGIQIYNMMKYIDEYYPNAKMMGSVAKLKLLRGYHLVSLDFNEQYSYFYMLMARKNLDQPLGDSKTTLIKFNEKIASKYRAGLSLKYLDSYLENEIVPNSIKSFYELNKVKQTTRKDFENSITSNSNKNVDWYFKTIIDSREIIDYKFDRLSKTKDSISFSLTNKTDTHVPIPIYGLKNNKIVFKKWIDKIKKDSIYTFERNNADKIVINYKNEVPEFNLRNNWKSLKPLKILNKPLKFNFMKDLEDPYYNQILYVPTLQFNIYDGFLPGMRLHNKTILDKPFNFDINPTFSTKTSNLSGSGFVAVNQYNRDKKLFLIRYSLSGSIFHYAQDAFYTKLNPSVTLRIRENNLRDNRVQSLLFRQVTVNREKSNFVAIDNTEQNYSIFNFKYLNNKTEATNHISFQTDFEASNKFGKLAAQVEYRKLFNNNRQINLRLYAGSFLYKNTNSEFFSFGIDRPTDYLFDYDYLGRSESTGIFSQQIIIAEGGFKSILQSRYANKWIATLNSGFSVWNWIEVYGDIGIVKNKFVKEKFIYDSGIRLNLVTDFFELYLPVYSSNGWEIAQPNYGEKIRFVVTFSPKTLTKLFTRKWF
ncbi:aminopeptidase [Flavobacterium sp.]|uniref:aminopeptidase n=1 Tax=Flavobacterium sp. TaxID=239 RepID=UPI0037520B2E